MMSLETDVPKASALKLINILKIRSPHGKALNMIPFSAIIHPSEGSLKLAAPVRPLGAS